MELEDGLMMKERKEFWKKEKSKLQKELENLEKNYYELENQRKKDMKIQ